jgi:CBS domain containing-hemolysin-like protein
MKPEDLSQLVGMLLMLGGFAFFAMSEISIFSLQKVDREALKEDSSIGPTLTHLLSRPRRLLAALLIGTEITGATMTALSASLIAGIAPTMPWLNVVIVAPMLVFFGDVLPQTIGFRFARSSVRFVVRPLSFWNELVSPVRWALSGAADLVLKGLGISSPPAHEQIEEEHLRVLIEQGRATGVIQEAEEEIINRVFDFGDLRVARLMTPRPDIVSLSVTTPWVEIWETIRKAGYSRIPFYQGNPDNVLGILHIKDLLKIRSQPPNARQLQKMLHPPLFVPPSKRAQDLLREFRSRNQHMAIVVDEHGSIVGLLTLDDLLAELVGEILDESDIEEPEVRSIGTNVWSIRAAIDIEDFTEKVGIELPAGDYTTLAGFIFHQLGEAPKKGDSITWDGARYLITGVEGRRITDVTVSLETQEEENKREENKREENKREEIKREENQKEEVSE